MAQQYEAATHHLVDIITALKIGRQSGWLEVRRGEGLTSETGILTFQRGQVTQARAGRRSGAEAVNWLSTWGQASYTFTPSDSEDVPFFSTLPSSSSGGNISQAGPRTAQVRTDKLETEPLDGSTREIPGVCVPFAEAGRMIEQAGLSRMHRRLYLLIDGQRAASDLAPLLGKKTEEVHSMLHDLVWLGVVRFTDPLPT